MLIKFNFPNAFGLLLSLSDPPYTRQTAPGNVISAVHASATLLAMSKPMYKPKSLEEIANK